MKKKILSAVLACAATMAVSVSAFAAGTTATPGATDAAPGATDKTETKTVTATVEVGEITDAGKVLEAKDLFTGDAAVATWADVDSIEFTSEEGTFALVFSVEKGAVKDKEDAETFTKLIDEYKADDLTKALAEKQTLTAEDAGHVAKSVKKQVTLLTAEGKTAKVTAKVTATVKADAKAPNTGIALAIAPAALAVSFVTVAAVMSKKKKG